MKFQAGYLVWFWMAASWMLAVAASASPATIRQAQVNQAVDRAVASMQWRIEQVQLTPTLTVGQLLDQVGGRAQLDETLHRAQLIGGPRWMADGRCQVRLEIDAPHVARILSAVAAAHPKASPISQEALQTQLAQWHGKKFVSEGVYEEVPTTRPSPSADDAPAAPATRPSPVALPEQPPAWVDRTMDATGRSAPKASSLKAFQAARIDAQRKLLDQAMALSLSPNLTLAQASQADPAIAQSLHSAVSQGQTDRVVFEEDGSVQLRVHLELWRLWRQLLEQAEPR